MIEMRWALKKYKYNDYYTETDKVLQYRQIVDKLVKTSPHPIDWFTVKDWSEWIDVPTVVEE